jgi:nitrile hydratase accessory protein
MTTRVEPDADGPLAPPRRNGELVFESPWETRAFGLAVSLAEAGIYDWDELRSRLMDEIEAWEHDHGETASGPARTPAEGWSYYERFLASFERLLVEKGVLTHGEIEGRTEEFASGAREEVY